MLAGLLMGCDDGQAITFCTEIGCTSALEVLLEDEPAPPYRVEADASGGTGSYVYECPASSLCPPIVFADFTPDRVTIRVVTSTDTTRYEVRPRYEENQPNGPGCDPICLRSVVRLPSDALTISE